jgi:hypothetical protein
MAGTKICANCGNDIAGDSRSQAAKTLLAALSWKSPDGS